MRLTTRTIRILLWTTQALLAALFLFAGGVKLAMPSELLEAQAKMSGEFLKFIAVAELLGAIGLILPAALRIYPGLTPLAAAGLMVIMVGAVGTSITIVGLSAALLPVVTGVAAAFVAYGRWRLAPIDLARRPSWTRSGPSWRSRRITA